MSLDFYVGEVQAQTNAATLLAQEYSQFSGQLKDSVNAFFTAPLSGKAYESAKQYFSTVYPPLANAFVLACEAFIDAHKKLPEEFQAQVDTTDVIEDRLKAQIAEGQELVQRITTLIDKQKTEDFGLEKRYMNACNTVQHLQEKLANLYAFNAYSAGIFSEYEACLANLEAGLAEVEKGSAWNATSGTFELKNMNLEWIKPINTAWEERQRKIDEKVKKFNSENEEIGYQFDEAGNLIGVFVNGKFDPEQTRYVQGLIQKRDIDKLKEFGSGFIDQWANNNGKSVLNELFGERQVNPQLADTSGYATGQFVADLASFVQGGAEYVGGFLWMFGGTSASFAGAPATGGASTAAIPVINASGLALSGHGAGVLRSAWDSLNNGYSGNKSHMVGENGTQTTSKTTWKKGKTERVDVENPSPGKRPGEIHYHEPNNKKWRFDIDSGMFVDPKTKMPAPPKIQKKLKDKNILNGIRKGLDVLGE
jgi:hypothetical protein